MKKIMHFNRQERMGAAALILIGLVAFFMPTIQRWAAPRYHTDFSQFKTEVEQFRQKLPPASTTSQSTERGPSTGHIELFAFNPNTATMEDFTRLGLSEKTAKSICNYRDKGGHFRKPEDFKKIYTLSEADYKRLYPYIQLEGSRAKQKDVVDRPLPEANTGQESETPATLVAFDPNTADEAAFLKMGLPQWIATRIINYRSKGGKFRVKEDLGKIYGFPETDYKRLEPYIAIAAVEKTTKYPSGSRMDMGPTKSNTVGQLDINQAAAEHWQMLPGIGEKRAQMIVGFREKLGGFISVKQVAETRGLPDSIYQRILPMLKLESGDVHTININTATAEQLSAHPYISFKQASLIIANRSQNGNYEKVEDMLRIPAFIDKVWLERVKPYLSVR